MKKLGLLLALSFFSQSAFSFKQALSEQVFKIRDPKTNSADFRKSLERIGQILSYQLLEKLPTKNTEVKTLTNTIASHSLVSEDIVLVTILRAGQPLNEGALKVFKNAEVGYFAMSRNEQTLAAQVDYIAIPNISHKTVVITDTMLATGGSILDAIKVIEKHNPKKIYVLSAIASKKGIERINQYNKNIEVLAAAIDPQLNDKGYIIPGLGDAGDRAYGDKHIINNK